MPDTNHINDIKVSVIIPTYNRASSLVPAVKSALAQNYRDIEVIVVDDASNDDTAIILAEKAAKSPNLRVIRHETNKGAAAARNTGIKASHGEWIALLDSDDLWVVDKLERQLSYLQEKGCDMGTTHAVFRRMGSEDLAERLLPEQESWTRDLVQGLGVNAGSTLLVRKNLFDEVGFFDENLKRLEDWEWFIRAMLLGKSFGNAPFNGSIIQVGGSPSVKAVSESTSILHKKHAQSVYDKWGGDMSQRFQCALRLEVAATKLWQKDFIGFTSGWFDAATHHPMLAAEFFLTRIKRILLGDAPRFFQMFGK